MSSCPKTGNWTQDVLPSLESFWWQIFEPLEEDCRIHCVYLPCHNCHFGRSCKVWYTLWKEGSARLVARTISMCSLVMQSCLPKIRETYETAKKNKAQGRKGPTSNLSSFSLALSCRISQSGGRLRGGIHITCLCKKHPNTKKIQ